MPYDEQVAVKRAELEALFGAFWPVPIPVVPSPVAWHYRNKVDPAFGRRFYETPPPPGFERESVLGFKRKGRWDWPLDVEECLIGPEGLGALLGAVRAWMRASGLRAYDNRTKQGFLRALLVREAKRTGQRMVVLITSEGAFEAGPFLDAVHGVYRADSVYRGVFRGLADVAAADELTLLDGAASIDEELHVPDGAGVRRLCFRISPFSFFQTNTLATERLYGLIRDWVRRVRPDRLYDLYGGAGGIAFTCADLAGEVRSVENVAAASEDGRHNARVNGVGNVVFVTDRVKNDLKWQLRDGARGTGAAAVVDPPRAGLVPKALRRLVELGPERLLYVSCNPKILARELPVLLDAYALESLQGVDLFPHTRHVEVLASFALKRTGAAR